MSKQDKDTAKKILVCDDDQGISEVMKVMLESDGYLVNVVNNGRAIQKKVKEYKPNLILLDIWMPGIDGKEITKLLKKDKDSLSIPIVVVSALNDTKKISQDCGADGFLSKPFEMSTLLELAKKYTS